MCFRAATTLPTCWLRHTVRQDAAAETETAAESQSVAHLFYSVTLVFDAARLWFAGLEKRCVKYMNYSTLQLAS